MNICIISTSYPNENGIGNTFVEQLVNAITLLGHNCIVISPLFVLVKEKSLHYKKYEVKQIEKDKIVKVYRPRVWSRNIPFIPISLNKYLAQRVFENTIKKNHLKIDIIYCHFFVPAELGWHYAHKNKIPLFVATGESKIPQRPFQKPCWSFSWSKFKKDTTGVVCVSTKNLEECVSLGYAERNKCCVFPNGVNLKLFKPLNKTECRRKLGYSIKDYIVIAVGEFSERKGQERIINAIDQLPTPLIKSIFIGSGKELPDRSYILFKGKVAHNMLPLYLSAADVFVLPTLREGCCNAIVEAMACGLPIISSDKQFNYDILDETNSILINPESIDEISKAVMSLFCDRDLSSTLSKGAILRSQELSIVNRARNIIKFIQSATNK